MDENTPTPIRPAGRNSALHADRYGRTEGEENPTVQPTEAAADAADRAIAATRADHRCEQIAPLNFCSARTTDELRSLEREATRKATEQIALAAWLAELIERREDKRSEATR